MRPPPQYSTMWKSSGVIDMDGYFRELADKVFTLLRGDEVLLLNFDGENSDFVRFNRNAIRQAGHVCQQQLHIVLINTKKQATAAIDLCGNLEVDLNQTKIVVGKLREQLPLLPDDPYIHYATERHDTITSRDNTLPGTTEAVSEIIATAHGLDLVGIWASGDTTHGFANSLGQFNWYRNYSFNFDWSLYQHDDKAVKQSYAGFAWQRNILEQKFAYARETLTVLARPARTIQPGRYRVYLTPTALGEVIDLLSWGGFGLKSHRTAQTPLLRMIEVGTTLNPEVNITEHHATGLTPPFTGTGFIKPDRVELIKDGAYQDCLADTRSAMEYTAPVNCDVEMPQSLEIAGGELHLDDILGTLDTGIFISNLWYCNYSDRSHCRITGMTRFASLWVENGQVVAPLNVMRFDETIYNILGNNLLAMTTVSEHTLDASTYERRSEASTRLPGVLVDDFNFTI